MGEREPAPVMYLIAWLVEGVQGLLLAAVEQTFMILGESSDQPEAADDPPGLGALEARRECPG